MAFDSDDSWFRRVYPKLAAALQRIRGAKLVHERDPDWEPVWFNSSDTEEDAQVDQEPSRSYHLFFVCPEGEAFTYDAEIETLAEPDWEWDEDESKLPMKTVAGNGKTGWVLAVSLIAPFAVITLSDMQTFEDGSRSEPTLESDAFTETGQRIDPEADFLKFKGEQAFQILLNLRGRICEILKKHRISVLPEAEWRKPVPGLRADEAVFAGTGGEPLRVLDALFFEGL